MLSESQIYVENIATISNEKIEEILGDAMVESIIEHFVTIDKCEAVSECDTCPKMINIPNLFTVRGEPPFNFSGFGLPSELADNIKLRYNTPTKVRDRSKLSWSFFSHRDIIGQKHITDEMTRS